MTTPFRRRHHDDESAHDRARALTAWEMQEPLDELQGVWLAGHLEACAECRSDREAYLADRSLLRGLREAIPEPPRDLRARTMAALDREALARSRRGRALGRAAGRSPSREPGTAREPGRRPSMPFGAAAGALIVLVVVGATVLPRLVPPVDQPNGTQSAVLSPEVQATPFDAPAVDDVAWIQPGVDGAWNLVLADITSLCPRTRPSCQPLGEDVPGRRVELGSVPHGITISPTETQLVVETRASGSTPGRILVVSLPPEPVAPTPEPVATGTPGPDQTATPGTTPTTSEPPTASPSAVAVTPVPSTDVPRGAVEIASGVAVVGETVYSPDGAWLAFSARPSDGSHGPDLYLWQVGQPTAIAVTDDHASYFSAWLGNRLLVSHVEPAAALEDPLASPGASVEPGTSAEPGASVEPGASDAPSADPSPAATAEPANTGRATSFLLDPATLARSELSQPDVWMPVVDPTGRFVTYWSGTLVRATAEADWQPGTGSLVFAAWSDGTAPAATGSPDATAPADATAVPDATVAAAGATDAPPALGPVGATVEVVPGPMAAFRTSFDPTGSRLAVWVGESIDGDVGRLHLLVIDPDTGSIDTAVVPLPGVPALRRFSIDTGRLAWVSPSGQDGQDSAVQILGWSGNEFGEMRAIPARQMYLVR
jgi:hypothetical protein